MNIVERIKQSFSETYQDKESLNKYSRDASIFSVKPQIVLKPKNSDEIKKLVNIVREANEDGENASITARAAGTCMSGGSLNQSVIIDSTKYLNKFNIDGLVAEVEPGVYYRDFEKESLKKGVLFPSYPASKDLCAFGGIVGNNAGGEKSLTYGKTEDYVSEMSVVLADGNEYYFKDLNSEELESKKNQNNFEGEIYRKIDNLISSNEDLINTSKPRVSKNSSGYAIWNVKKNGSFNLSRLFVGAQGTLGIFTKAKINLIKPHPYSSLLVISMKDLKDLGRLVKLVLEHKPEDFESYDDKTLKLAIKFLPKILKKIGGNPFKLLFSFIPELGLLIKGGFPKLVLLAEFTGDSQSECLNKVNKVKDLVEKDFNVVCHIAKTKKDATKYWTIRRESFSLLRNSVGNKKTAPFIDDIIVKPEHLPEFIPRLNDILNEYNDYMIYTIAGHAGDGNFHIIPLMDLSDSKTRDIIFEISERVYDLVLEYDGSISAEHNDGIIRTPYLNKMFNPEMMNIFKEIKNIFDPLNIFNPGKKVGGTIEYAKEHINK